MNDTKNKDKALRRALCEREQPRLPSIFAYRTMQQVYHAELERRKRQRITTRWITALSMSAVGCLGCLFLYIFVDFNSIRQTMVEAFDSLDTTPFIISVLPILIALLLLFDTIMRHRYSKQRQNQLQATT